jgi:DNA-binding response OmpR family regulator
MSTKKILVVDDEKLIADSLRYSLRKEGYEVVVAHDGQEAIERARREDPDLIVLDLMLPGVDGLEVCRTIRQESIVPIIMLTARGEEMDRVIGLEIGADDYLVKPFSFRELLARIRAALRRASYAESPAEEVLVIGEISLDMASHRVLRSGQEVELTRKEYDLLQVLMENAGRVVARNDIIDRVWDTDWVGDTRTLDVHIRWLREKIEDNPSKPRYIQTVRGVGYRFATPEEIAESV